MKRQRKTSAAELRLANKIWGTLSRSSSEALTQLVEAHRLSISMGDLAFIDGRWYVTHTGLLGIAQRNRCCGIHVRPVAEYCDSRSQRWAFQATVYKSKTCRGFVGFGDADPSNVSSLVQGAEMRVAETRAVNRALRKAYGIGLCSVEEIGSSPVPNEKLPPKSAHADRNGNGTAPKVRDRLCQIIRQHQLDPNLVKSYATDFCGVKTLREATREQVENFVTHLAAWAEKDRNALLCQLNSYLGPKEGAA